jgi:hypothetical protein
MADNELTGKERLVGYIDLLGGGLTVLGWAWFEQDPERRAEIEFLINGEVAGGAIADRHRPDVEQAAGGVWLRRQSFYRRHARAPGFEDHAGSGGRGGEPGG